MDTLPALCLLLALCSLTLAVDETVPLPDDFDGSGDDEDFSGSGSDAFFVESESKDVTVFTTSISTLVPTVKGSTAAQEPEIVEKEETKTEDTTESVETTTSPSDYFKDPIAVDTGDSEVTTKEATTSPPFQQEETDAKKHHHHHHHHHHPHHHTTTSSTTLPSESGGDDDDTTDVLLAVDLPEQTTTHIPDTEPGLHHVSQELTTFVGDLAKQGVLHEETTSGATSTYVDNEEAAVDPLNNLPALITTTVAEESRTQEDHHPHHHHHHHHHHPHHTTTTPFVELGVTEEETTKASDPVEPESNAEGGERATTVSEDEHPPDGHHHVTATMSAEPEKPHVVHTSDPKGRRVHVPDGRSTTAVPVISEDEHIPEDTENDNFTSTTAQYNVSRSPFDENDEVSDSKEEGPSGVADEDIFFESTNSVLNEGRMNPSSEEGNSDEGSSDASHGIMERKELLAGIIAGGVAGLVFAAALVVFVLYRMKKKDEGSYSLEEPKQSNGGYQKPREQREFYA
ncbi:syndecan-1 [Dendrobates tinctorius]|uniref:syndecan-1 n=1 Tax=Dendrobates tinctorius TaxID=92724 RepID=UPI003CCA5F42